MVMAIHRVHHLSLFSISKTRSKFSGYIVVLRPITLANEPRVFILSGEHHFIVFFALWARSIYFLYGLRVYDMLYIGLLSPLSGVVVFITKYNSVLGLFLRVASHTHIEPIQIADLLDHY